VDKSKETPIPLPAESGLVCGARFRLALTARQRGRFWDAIEQLERLKDENLSQELKQAVSNACVMAKLAALLAEEPSKWLEGGDSWGKRKTTVVKKKPPIDIDTIVAEISRETSLTAERLVPNTALNYYYIRCLYMKEGNQVGNSDFIAQLVGIGEGLAHAESDPAIRANLYETLAILERILSDAKPGQAEAIRKCALIHCAWAKSAAGFARGGGWIFSEKTLREVQKDEFLGEIEKIETACRAHQDQA